MIGNLSTPKRLLTLVFLSVLLAACRAERTPPSLDTPTAAPAPPTPSPRLADAASAIPQPSATSTASPTPASSIPQPSATSTASPTPASSIPATPPGPRPLNWCPAGIVTCFDETHAFAFTRPVPLPIDPTYRYASTQAGLRELHRGVEFYAAFGAPVRAAASGQVVFAGDDMREKVALWPEFYGNYVVIAHEGEFYSLYAHLSQINVSAGQVVWVGEEIGLVGASGSAIGSHLHFEIRQGKNIYTSTHNPEVWLAPLEGAGALAGRIYDPAGGQPRGTIRIQRVENGKIAASRPPLPMDIYPPELVAENGENFALTDLPASEYRLTYLYNGKLYEYFVEIRPGILTLITIILD